MTVTRCISDLPAEILNSIFSYLLKDELLNLPKRLLYNGLSISEASKRYRILHVSMPCFRTSRSIPYLHSHLVRKVDNYTRHPTPASAVQGFIILETQMTPVSLNEDHNVQLVRDFWWKKHLQKHASTLAKTKYATAHHMHKYIGLKDGTYCKICGGCCSWTASMCLIHAIRAAKILEELHFSPQELSKHVRRMKNLKLIRFEFRQKYHSEWSGCYDWTAGKTRCVDSDTEPCAREVLCEAFGIPQESSVRFELKFRAPEDTYPMHGAAYTAYRPERG